MKLYREIEQEKSFTHSLIMTKEEKYAKVLALSIIYEKEEGCRMPFVERIACHENEVEEILNAVHDKDFKNWIKSVAPYFKYH
ncbi:MAG: hypothetical protein LBQ60_19835 [Bacteroidales bacterium]|jgi:hypothetical protein|nr:hypothetical protein [Bacteroidales bacterium]